MKVTGTKFKRGSQQKLEKFLKETKEARYFRRAQAVLAVVKGESILEVSQTFRMGHSNLLKLNGRL